MKYIVKYTLGVFALLVFIIIDNILRVIFLLINIIWHLKLKNKSVLNTKNVFMFMPERQIQYKEIIKDTLL